MAKKQQESEKEREEEPRPDEPAAEAPEDEDEEEEQERLNHWQAAHRVVKQIDGDTTLSELALDADKLVVASGGKSNEDRAYTRVYEVLQSLAELGLVEMTEEVTVHPLHRLPSSDGQK